MKWDRLHREPCPVARTVAVIGDRWTCLLLRDCFFGVRRFEGFQSRLGISRTIIADRLDALVSEGVLRREPYQTRPVRHEYQLTPKGLALYPILMSMAHWGDVHSAPHAGGPRRFRHKTCGKRLRPTLICAACGETVAAHDVEPIAVHSSVPKSAWRR